MIMGLERLDRIVSFTEEAKEIQASPFLQSSLQNAGPFPVRGQISVPTNGRKVYHQATPVQMLSGKQAFPRDKSKFQKQHFSKSWRPH